MLECYERERVSIMVIASIVLGILLIIGGIYCMSAPVNTYVSVMTFAAGLLFVYGIHGIIRFFRRRSYVPEFIVSILAVIIGFVYLFRPGNTPEAGNLIGIDRFVLFLVAAWFLIKGCISVYFFVKTRFFNDRWVIGFLSGLLSIAVGIYSFIYPSLAATAVGVLVGMWYIDCGLDLLAFGTAAGMIQSAVNEVEREIDNAVDEAVSAVRTHSEERRAAADKAADTGAAEAPAETADTPEKPE